jgi:polyferredoxin
MSVSQRPVQATSSPAQRYRTRQSRTQGLRHLSQALFVGVILTAAVIHNLSTMDGATPSIDALCPFGGFETLWTWIVSGGSFVPKTHLSNLILAGGLLLGVLVSGGAFCGWVCPFGALQDALTWVRARLRIPEVRVPAWLDRVLRYGRYVVLALILYKTATTVTLMFADVDPYRTLFSLEWLFDFNPAEQWPAYLVAGVVVAASLLIERAWCRYLCPLGGAISLLGNFSLLRIRRAEATCKDCALCERPCPVKLNVARAETISSNCIGCLACVQACPRHNTLEVQLAPAWLPRRKPAVVETPAGD